MFLSEFLVLLLFLAVIGIPVYKWRDHIKKFIKIPKYGCSYEVDTVTRANRRITKAEWALEDAKASAAYETEKADTTPDN